MLEGFFKGLHRIGTRPVADESLAEGLIVLLQGQQTFPLELVGTGRRQSEISLIANREGACTQRHHCLAVLSIDPAIPANRPNVAAYIEGVHVGYLPSYLSTRYREWLKSWSLCRASVHCRAMLHAERTVIGGGLGEYRVKLDVEVPFRMTTIQA